MWWLPPQSMGESLSYWIRKFGAGVELGLGHRPTTLITGLNHCDSVRHGQLVL
ncbi:unnamed protein product [Periconia digitata]|uniref:Uncharacterized protein n=1 Tax=Periconia digitata TaxID=1303443 RepID=A0A9W4XIK4_9PLEO|nr:unnamed protein product [Periconia digitata]